MGGGQLICGRDVVHLDDHVFLALDHRPDLVVDIDAIMRLMDYDAMRELERRLLTTEALETKYGPASGASQAARST